MDNHFGNIVHIKLRYPNLTFQCIHIRTVVDGTRHPDSFGSSGANDIPITQLGSGFSLNQQTSSVKSCPTWG